MEQGCLPSRNVCQCGTTSTLDRRFVELEVFKLEESRRQVDVAGDFGCKYSSASVKFSLVTLWEQPT